MSKQKEKAELFLTGTIENIDSLDKGNFNIIRLVQEREYEGNITIHKFDVMIHKDRYDEMDLSNGERIMILASLTAPERSRKDGGKFHPVSIWASNVLKTARKLAQPQQKQMAIEPHNEDIPF